MKINVFRSVCSGKKQRELRIKFSEQIPHAFLGIPLGKKGRNYQIFFFFFWNNGNDDWVWNLRHNAKENNK